MSVDWGIEIQGAGRISAALRISPEVVAEEFHVAMTASTQYVWAEVSKGTPVDEGRLAGAIAPHVEGFGLFIRGVVGVEGVEYGPYIEFGTDPHFPPIEAITEWVRRKGLWRNAVDAYKRRRKFVGPPTRKENRRAVAFRKAEAQRKLRGEATGEKGAKERAIEEIAEAVRWKIGLYGTEPVGMFEKGWQASKARVADYFEQAFARIARRISGA